MNSELIRDTRAQDKISILQALLCAHSLGIAPAQSCSGEPVKMIRIGAEEGT